MPKRDPITKQFPIPAHLHLLKQKIDRKCDKTEWGINNMLNKISAITPFVSDLKEREKQLFEYYHIPYIEITQNEIHYLIRQLAAAAGFHGFEYKKFAPDGHGGWNGKFGTIFYFRVVLQQMTTKQKKTSVCIKQVKESHREYKQYEEYDLSKRFAEIPKNNETVKFMHKFNFKEFNALSEEEQNTQITETELLLNTLTR